MTAHKSNLVKASTPKSHQYDTTSPSPRATQQLQNGGPPQQVSERRHEYRTRRRQYQSAHSLDQLDPQEVHAGAVHAAVAPATQLKSYSTLNMSQLGVGRSDVSTAGASNSDCLILYDGESADGVARSSLEAHSCIDFGRSEARVAPSRSLEDSGIDVKSPPSSSRTGKAATSQNKAKS